MILLKIWIVICPFLAVLGQERELGYWKSLFILYLLPVIGILIVVNSPEKREETYTYTPPKELQFSCGNCTHKDWDRKHIYCPNCKLDKDGYVYFEDMPGEKFEPRGREIKGLLPNR